MSFRINQLLVRFNGVSKAELTKTPFCRGLDFSSTEFANTFGVQRCTEGRIQIDFRITNNQLLDPVANISGMVLPEVLEAKSKELFPNDYCTLEDMFKPETGGFRCSGNYLQQCISYNLGTDTSLHGALRWYSVTLTGCPVGTTCQHEVSSLITSSW